MEDFASLQNVFLNDGHFLVIKFFELDYFQSVFLLCDQIRQQGDPPVVTTAEWLLLDVIFIIFNEWVSHKTRKRII